jgi:hypothetical protein
LKRAKERRTIIGEGTKYRRGKKYKKEWKKAKEEGKV